MTCISRSRTLLRKTNIRRTRSTPRTHDAFTRVVTASHLRSPPHLHPHVRRVSFEVRHHSSRSRPPVVVAFPARADVVFFSRRIELRVDVVVTKRRHRACDEEFCVCTHADVRARHLVIAEVSLPPRRSISSIVAFSGATSLATRLIFFVEIPRERAPIARRFSAGFRAARAGRPSPGTRAGAASRRGGVPRARASSGRSGIFPSPSLQPSKTFDRHDTRSNLHSQKRAEISAEDISLGRIDRRNDGSVLFFFWFGLGLPNGRGLLTKHAPRISDLRVRVSSSSFHRTPIARTQ